MSDEPEKQARAGTDRPGVSPFSGYEPPPEHRFKPGQSGNPHGRPPDTVKGLAKRLRWMLEKDGNKTLDELIGVALRESRHDLGWFKATTDRAYGKAPDVSLTGNLDDQAVQEMRSMLVEAPEEDETGKEASE